MIILTTLFIIAALVVLRSPSRDQFARLLAAHLNAYADGVQARRKAVKWWVARASE